MTRKVVKAKYPLAKRFFLYYNYSASARTCMNATGIILLIILGAASGFFYNRIRGKSKGGLLGAMSLGILGAVEGGCLATFLFGFTTPLSRLQSLFFAILGTFILLTLRIVFEKRKVSDIPHVQQ